VLPETKVFTQIVDGTNFAYIDQFNTRIISYLPGFIPSEEGGGRPPVSSHMGQRNVNCCVQDLLTPFTVCDVPLRVSWKTMIVMSHHHYKMQSWGFYFFKTPKTENYYCNCKLR